MKTIDEIISRTDYINLNSALKNRCIKIARIIRSKMEDLDIDEISVNGRKYNIVKRHTYSGFSTEYLAVHCYIDYEEWDLSLEQTSFEYYTGDFHCAINPATSKLFLEFLNNAKAIFEQLDEIETSSVNAINEAMAATKDLVE